MSLTFLSTFQYPISVLNNRRRQVPLSNPALLANTLKVTGRSLVVGTLAGAFMVFGRMHGNEEIEWQDRAWRILENKGEVRTDWAAFGGAGMGAVVGLIAARRGVVPATASTAILGGAGLGMASGVPFMVYTFASGRKPA